MLIYELRMTLPRRTKLQSVRNSPLGQIVRTHGDLYPVTGQNFYLKHAHLAGEVAQNFMPAVQPYDKRRSWFKLQNFSLGFNEIFGVGDSRLRLLISITLF